MNHHHNWQGSMVSHSARNRPMFENHCEHLESEFVGSCEYWNRGPNPTPIDVYVHGDDQEVCIRTSNEPGDYCTCGTICDLIHTCGAHQAPMHRAALELIDTRFRIRAERLNQ